MKRILHHLGLNDIVPAAVEAATRLANRLLFEKVVNSLSHSDDCTNAEVIAPDGFIVKSIPDLDLDHRISITLVTIRPIEIGRGFLGIGKGEREVIGGVPKPRRTVGQGDTLVTFGRKESGEQMIREF